MKQNNARQARELPQVEQLEKELKRVRYQSRFRKLLRSTVYTLIVVAAAAVLIAAIFLRVLRIYGSSMTPTVSEGEIVVALKGSDVKPGDVVALYYGSKVLIKRCIATAGQQVYIDADGNVYVDDRLLDEPYVTEKVRGEFDIDPPYTVPEGSVFVLGDKRSTAIDSRRASIGCFVGDDIIGRVFIRVWPLARFGSVRGY